MPLNYNSIWWLIKRTRLSTPSKLIFSRPADRMWMSWPQEFLSCLPRFSNALSPLLRHLDPLFSLDHQTKPFTSHPDSLMLHFFFFLKQPFSLEHNCLMPSTSIKLSTNHLPPKGVTSTRAFSVTLENSAQTLKKAVMKLLLFRM